MPSLKQSTHKIINKLDLQKRHVYIIPDFRLSNLLYNNCVSCSTFSHRCIMPAANWPHPPDTPTYLSDRKFARLTIKVREDHVKVSLLLFLSLREIFLRYSLRPLTTQSERTTSI